MGGRDKLLEPAGGLPLLTRTARIACAAGAPVVAVLPPRSPQRRAALSGLPVALVEAPQPARGMGHSLATGIRAVGSPDGVMILLADMPDITAADLDALLRAVDGHAIVQATTESGVPGHPVVFPRDLLPELASLDGDRGAKPVLARHAGRIRRVPLPGERAATDLDTPGDWQDWRRRQ
jgi:CTP:molybdopterin cytidylyltransferase MocA